MSERHEKMMLFALERFGMPEGARPDVWVLTEELSKQGEKTKFQAWTCESLLYAVREIAMGERCNWRIVVRCFRQAREYLGRTDRFAASCHVYAALSWLTSKLEERVSCA
jgi:hypothetical protein